MLPTWDWEKIWEIFEEGLNRGKEGWKSNNSISLTNEK